MAFWRDNVDKILYLNDKAVLDHKGKITNEQMKKQVSAIYEQFDCERKQLEAQQADEDDLRELQALETQLKQRSSNKGDTKT